MKIPSHEDITSAISGRVCESYTDSGGKLRCDIHMGETILAGEALCDTAYWEAENVINAFLKANEQAPRTALPLPLDDIADIITANIDKKFGDKYWDIRQKHIRDAAQKVIELHETKEYPSAYDYHRAVVRGLDGVDIDGMDADTIGRAYLEELSAVSDALVVYMRRRRAENSQFPVG